MNDKVFLLFKIVTLLRNISISKMLIHFCKICGGLLTSYMKLFFLLPLFQFIDSVALVACEILISTLNTPIADLQEKKELLSAVLRRMQTRRSEQSLNPRFLLIWAHLIKTRIDAAFELFFDIPSCVEFVSNELCRNYMCFSHEDRKNIVTPALCKIIAHGLTHRESQLHHIMFEGDSISFIQHKMCRFSTR